MSELRIAVMVKQVPDPSLVEISEDGRLMRENVPAMMDPYGTGVHHSRLMRFIAP